MSTTRPLEYPPSPTYTYQTDAEIQRQSNQADARRYPQVGLTLSETAHQLAASKSRHQADLDAAAALAERRRVAISTRAEKMFGTVISHMTSRRATTMGTSPDIVPAADVGRVRDLARNCFKIAEAFEDQREAWEKAQLEKQEVS